MRLEDLLTSKDLVGFISADELHIEFTTAVLTILQRGADALHHHIECKTPIYGFTTGFGPFVQYQSVAAANDDRGSGLVAHLGAGFGAPLPAEIVRGAMLLRLHTVAQGYSGISPEAARFYAAMIEKHITPFVPSVGSLGASGDLIPLAHIVRAMTGEGEILQGITHAPAEVVLRKAGLKPFRLKQRDALALVNGTSFSTALLAFAVVRGEQLTQRLEELTGWLYVLLGARQNGLEEELHRLKRHQSQLDSAQDIRRYAASYLPTRRHLEGNSLKHKDWSGVQDETRPLQEVYSVRCAPQILGAVRDSIAFATLLTEREMAGVDDNPIITEADVLHGGNFMTQHIAFAADTLNNALTQAANLAERQIAVLLNPELNGGAPLLLAYDPQYSSGMAGAQLTATALVAEMRQAAQCYASSTLPTNGNNQDIVPMGFQAARVAYEQVHRFAGILAIEALVLAQLNSLHSTERVRGIVTRLPAWMKEFKPLTTDRALHGEIERLTKCLLKICR